MFLHLLSPFEGIIPYKSQIYIKFSNKILTIVSISYIFLYLYPILDKRIFFNLFKSRNENIQSFQGFTEVVVNIVTTTLYHDDITLPCTEESYLYVNLLSIIPVFHLHRPWIVFEELNNILYLYSITLLFFYLLDYYVFIIFDLLICLFI